MKQIQMQFFIQLRSFLYTYAVVDKVSTDTSRWQLRVLLKFVKVVEFPYSTA